MSPSKLACILPFILPVQATLTSPQAEESPSFSLAETLSTKDSIIFAFSFLYLLALRLWSFRTRLITTDPPHWSNWQSAVLLFVAVISHIAPLIGTLYVDDPWGSESWAWAQIVPPLLPPALIWAFSGVLRTDAREGRRERASMVGLVRMLQGSQWQVLLAGLLLLADWAFLAWLQGFDVIILSAVSLVTILLEIEPGRRLSTPLINRSRGSALGAGFAFARTTDIGAVGAIASLQNGRVVYEDSIYQNPVAQTEGEEFDGQVPLSPFADVRHRFEVLSRARIRLGHDARPEIRFNRVELNYDSVFPPDPGCYTLKCFLPDGLTDWLAHLASQQSTISESSSLEMFEFMAVFSLIVEEYRTTWTEFYESEESEPVPVRQDWRKIGICSRETQLIREASMDMQEEIFDDLRRNNMVPVPSEAYSPLRVREDLLHSFRTNARGAMHCLDLDMVENQSELATFWSDGMTKPPLISAEELLRRYPLLRETIFNQNVFDVHEEYLMLPTPAIILAALAVVAEDGNDGDDEEDEELDVEKAVYDDPFTEVKGLFAEARAEEGVETRRKRYKLVKLWRKAASEGPFRVRWSDIRPFPRQRKNLETSSSGDTSTHSSENDIKGDSDRVEDENPTVPGAIMFQVLQGSADTSWVEEYANVFEKMLRDPYLSRIISDFIVKSKLDGREDSLGTRRLLEVRHAIVERLLLLQSIASVLIGAKALFAAI